MKPLSIRLVDSLVADDTALEVMAAASSLFVATAAHQARATRRNELAYVVAQLRNLADTYEALSPAVFDRMLAGLEPAGAEPDA